MPFVSYDKGVKRNFAGVLVTRHIAIASRLLQLWKAKVSPLPKNRQTPLWLETHPQKSHKKPWTTVRALLGVISTQFQKVFNMEPNEMYKYPQWMIL